MSGHARCGECWHRLRPVRPDNLLYGSRASMSTHSVRVYKVISPCLHSDHSRLRRPPGHSDTIDERFVLLEEAHEMARHLIFCVIGVLLPILYHFPRVSRMPGRVSSLTAEQYLTRETSVFTRLCRQTYLSASLAHPRGCERLSRQLRDR